MKFRQNKYGIYQILIDDDWHVLCVCINCGEVHAAHRSNFDCGYVDRKIKCCNNPDNRVWLCDANEIIEVFIKKWEDKEK